MKILIHYTAILILTFSLFSCDEDFVSRDFPSVLTLSVTMDKDGSIMFSGELISRDAEAVDEVGFVWQSNGEPDIETGFKANLSGKVKTGPFQLKVFTSIKKNTEYYVRAYAFTNDLIIYGDTWVFVSEEDFLPPEFTLVTNSGHVGDTVEITGGLFNKTISKNSVSVNNLEAEVVEVKDSSILFIVPWSLTSKESNVKVFCEGTAREISEKFQLVTPAITSFSPDIVELLDTITIAGTGFHEKPEYNIVTFGSSRGTVVSSTSGTLHVVVPYSPDSPCFITISVSGQSATSQDKIEILQPVFNYFSPAYARHLDTITVSISNLSPEQITGIYFGSFKTRILDIGGTSISAEVPDKIVTESTPVRITFPGGEYTFSYNFNLLQPSITGVSPAKVSNFSHLNLSGVNFNPAASGNKVTLKNVQSGTEYLITTISSEYETIDALVRNQQSVNNGLPSGNYQVGIATCENTFWWGGTIEISDMWRQLEDFPGGERYKGAAFAVNGKGYAGLGTKMHNDIQKDLWEFNPATESWTRVADFPGLPRIWPFVFQNSSHGFVGGGQSLDDPAQVPYFDFYKYNPLTNSWSQLTNAPTVEKSYAVSYSSTSETMHVANLSPGKIWKYNSLNNSWSEPYTGEGITNHTPMTFSINGKTYLVGGNILYTGTSNEVWEYDPVSNTMTRKNDFPGKSRFLGFSFTIGGYGYIGCGVYSKYSLGILEYLTDVYRYDPQADSWTFVSNFPGLNKRACSSFVIGDRAYILNGWDGGSNLVDQVWEFYDTEAAKSGLK
jgi:N-acetylneuraminic acid mutarotase